MRLFNPIYCAGPSSPLILGKIYLGKLFFRAIIERFLIATSSLTRRSMNKQTKPNKSRLLSAFSKNYSGPLTHVALSALSAWMMVQGLKGLAGFTVNSQSAMADLVGIIVIVAIARWMKVKPDPK